MTKQEIQAEILRVEKALDKTDSVYLKKDYAKHLRKLKKQLKEVQNNEN